MKLQNITWVTASVFIFLVFALTACEKATAPASSITNQTSLSFSEDELKQQRLAWNLKTLVEPYEQTGHTDPKWNEAAKLALSEFARARANVTDINELWAEIISTNVAAAVQAGCDDPMVNYLFIKFVLAQTNSPKTFADAFCKNALDMQASSYPAIRKFYAAQRAVDQLFFTYGYGTNNIVARPALYKMEPLVGQNLLLALGDKTMPALEAFEAANASLTSMKGEGIADYPAYTQAYDAIEKPIFENWPNAYSSWLLKGEGYIQLAWAARGTGFANTVSEQGQKLFNERLAIAENALTNAWQLYPRDSRIADNMLEVELGQGEGRDRLELWFDRAMALNTNDYEACSSKLNYLQPKWYGSTVDMLQFGHECVTNMQWGGNVPLILLDAHHFISYMYTNQTDQEDYWKQPVVWADLNTAYKRFFEVNPNATGRYYQYAWYAYKCAQWRKFIELIPKLGPVNYDYFGGGAEFDKMVQLAKENISNPKPADQK